MNDKEGILTQVPPAWIRHPRENGRGIVWDLWLRCPQTHQRAKTASPRGYGFSIPISIYVTPADTHDTRGARCLLAGLKFFVPRLKKIWADAAYRGQELAQWCQATGDWELEVVERPSGTRGFSVAPAGSWSEHSVGFLVTEE